jgi:DNA-directed RNA polymerase subunit RPC12/RpoP
MTYKCLNCGEDIDIPLPPYPDSGDDDGTVIAPEDEEKQP